MSLENQHNDFDVFRKYYTGKMSASEKADFEKNLEADPFAQEAYEGFLALENDFQRISLIEKTNMKFKGKVGIESAGFVFPFKTVLGIAASVVLLLGSVLIVKNNFENDKSELAQNELNEEIVAVETIEQEEMFIDTNRSNTSDSLMTDEENLQKTDVIVKDVPLAVVEKEIILEKEQTNTTIKNKSADKKQIDFEDYYSNDKQTQEVAKEEDVRVTTTNASAQFNSIEYNDDSEIIENEKPELLISNYKSGIVAYNQSNYNDAVQFFNKAISANTNVNSSNYYLGMSYFNLGKSSKAINSFDQVIGTSSTFADDAQWYKALSLINKGQKDKAREELENLVKTGSSFKSAAQKKLDTL